MPRPLPDILTHLRAAIADGSIKTTLIQTEDLAVLCDAADPTLRPKPAFIEEALQPKEGWKQQPFEYYAAHFLAGAGLMYGDVRGSFLALTRALKDEYDLGVEHGRTAPTEVVALKTSNRT